MIRISVMYPNQNGKFDMDYYTQTHMALVHKLLDPFGLVRTEVDKGLGSVPPSNPAPYVAVGHLIFNSMEEMQKGMQAHDPDLGADLPNFTDIQPTFQISEILA
jgi:uncharacterized protein (TIGR02118 family)